MNAAVREDFSAFLDRMYMRGVTDPRLLAAIEAIPRGAFIATQWQDAVWSHGMIPIDCGEAMEGIDLQAATIAALGIEENHRVLEIGAGSGYTAALMSRLAQRIFTVERYATLAANARQRFERLGLNNIVVRHADGAAGFAGDGPFDRIIVWAAFDAVPRGFVEQVSINGVMIVPIGPTEGVQALARLNKVGSRFERTDIGEVRLQPILHKVAAVL